MNKSERLAMNGSGIFFDSADIDQFKKWHETHIFGGATTNPVLFQKANVLDVAAHIEKMAEISGPNFPISIELPDADMSIEDMMQLALAYRDRFPDNCVIKVPMKPDEPHKAFEVLYRLGQEGVRTNATIGMTMGQLIGASEAGRVSKADDDNYVSLFWARRDEAKTQIITQKIEEFKAKAENDGKPASEEEISSLKTLLESETPDAARSLAMTLRYLENHSLNTRVIVGSIRKVSQIEEAFSIGADIVTIPPTLLSEWMFTQRGVETVNDFNKAYREVADKIKLI